MSGCKQFYSELWLFSQIIL